MYATQNQPVSILNAVQHAEAFAVGRGRQLYAIERRLKHKNKLANDDPTIGFDIHIHGACGEKSVHLLFPGLPWHKGIGVLGLPDIGDFIDVRAPRQQVGRPYRHLLGYTDDKPQWAYVLALSLADRNDRFKIMGWVWGKELLAAPTRQFQWDRGLAHYLAPTIPPLHPIRELQKIAGITPPVTLYDVQEELRRCQLSGPAETADEMARRQALWRKLDELLKEQQP